MIPVAPVRVGVLPEGLQLVEVQAVPLGDPKEVNGKWYAPLHIQYKVREGEEYGSFDMVLVVADPEAWMIECSVFDHPSKSFSGSGREYQQLSRAPDGGWYLTQEGGSIFDPRFCLIQEGVKDNAGTTTLEM